MSRADRIDRTIEEHTRVLNLVRDALTQKITQAADALTDAFRNGHRALLFGNGGSASDALHIEGELTNRFYKDRPGLPALTLGASLSTLTATANDYAYDDLFARQVEAHGRKGDVALGISTSGTSKNVVRGLHKAKEIGLVTIGMTGESGGLVGESADILLAVPSTETPRIQEAHIVIGHLLCEFVEEALFSDR